MGKKYIVELPDCYILNRLHENKFLQVPIVLENGDDAVIRTVIPLTPYTEPDLEQVREEAYEKGFDSGRMLNTGKYEKGINDAWDAARTLWNTVKRKEIFGYTVFNTALMALTGQEAIEKIRQYEQEQEQEEEQIRVGDEVRNVKSGWTAVVTRISDDDCLTLMDGNGAIADGYDITRFTKTGRHFPKLVALQEEMRLR